MVAPIKFLSGRQQQQKIGLEGSTEEKKVLEVIGRAGIGTTAFEPSTELDVRGNISVSNDIIVGNNFDVIGGSSVTGDLDVDGRTELDTVNISETLNVTGISTFSSIDTESLNVNGVSTFTSDVSIGNSIQIEASSGIITANQFIIGTDGIKITTNEISGPEEITIDPRPAGVGVTSGIVRIKGDLYVDGTNFVIDSETITLADFVVGIASTVPNVSDLDGAGIGIGSDGFGINLKYEHNGGTNPSLKSSQNLNVASGKSYQINQEERLSATDLSLGTGTKVSAIDTNTLTLDTNSNERIRITSDGKIGIGETQPQAVLDVNGNVELDNVNVSGTVDFSTDQKFVGQYFADLDLGTHVAIAVTVSNNKFYLDGDKTPYLNLIPGKTYRFDQSDSTNTNEELRFYLEESATTIYSDGVTTNNQGGEDDAYTQIVVTDTTPAVLYYQSTGTSGLGNAVRIISSSVHMKNFGVGTKTPSFILDVGGQARNSDLTVTNKLGVGTALPVSDIQVGSISTFGYSTDGKVVSINADGQIGIGTTTPSSSLDVVGHTELDTLNVSAASTFHNDITVKLPTNGNGIGIGTTSFNILSDHLVDVRGNVNIDGRLKVSGSDITDLVTSLSGNFESLSVGSGNTGVFANNSGDLLVTGFATFSNQPLDIRAGFAATGGDVSIGTNIFYVDDSEQRVGIGSAIPTSTLDVNGDLTVTGYTTTQYLTIGPTGDKYTFPNNKGSINSFLRSDGNGNLDWYVNEQLRNSTEFTATASQTNFNLNYAPGLIDVFVNGVKLSTGDYVGTSGTDIILNVAASSGDNIEVVGFSTQSFSSRSILNFWKYRDDGVLYNDTSRIGIGASTWTEPAGVDFNLYVQGNTKINGSIYDSSNSRGDLQEVPVADGNGGWVWSSVPATGVSTAGGSIGNIQFHNAVGVIGGSNELHYDFANQKVGIGTTTPEKKLDVIGDVYIQGSIGIGTFTPSDSVSATNTTILAAGTVKANNLQGNGSGITSISADNISSGTIDSSLLSGSYDISVTGGVSGGNVTVTNLLTVGSGNTSVIATSDGDLSVSGIATLGKLYIGNTVGITSILDEDNMVSNSASALATQQSIKSYVDNEVSTLNTTIGDIDLDLDVSGTPLSIDLDSESLGIYGTTDQVSVTGSGSSATFALPESVTIPGTLTANSGIANTMTVSNTITGIGNTTDIITLYDNIDKSVYRSVEYSIQATQGSQYHYTKLLVIHNGTDTFLTEYGTVYTSSPIASYTSDIGGNFIRLRATAGAGSTAHYVVNFTTNKIFE